jgi:DNA-binding transcriptional LysR family regulator
VRIQRTREITSLRRTRDESAAATDTDRSKAGGWLGAIELRHLRYAEAAERCGSFRKAAESLSLKQSNLSRRIRRLEEHLGVRLFERSSAGVQTTSAGRDFVHGARRILEELQAVVDAARAAGRGEAGRLTISFYTSLSAGNLRATLMEYGRRFPQVDISTVEGSRARLFGAIQNGTVDIAIVTGEFAADHARSMMLWTERIIVALPHDHRLAANDIIHWTDLKRERVLLSERDPGPEMQHILLANYPGQANMSTYSCSVATNSATRVTAPA